MRLTGDTTPDVRVTAPTRTAEAALARLPGGASAARMAAVRGYTAIRQPAPNTATSATITELAPMDANTQPLDAANAIGGFLPSAAAPATSREPLIAISPPDRGIRDADRTTLTG